MFLPFLPRGAHDLSHTCQTVCVPLFVAPSRDASASVGRRYAISRFPIGRVIASSVYPRPSAYTVRGRAPATPATAVPFIRGTPRSGIEALPSSRSPRPIGSLADILHDRDRLQRPAVQQRLRRTRESAPVDVPGSRPCRIRISPSWRGRGRIPSHSASGPCRSSACPSGSSAAARNRSMP